MLLHNEYINLGYDPENGAFYRVKRLQDDYEIIRVLLPDEDLNLISLLSDGNICKKKAYNFAWLFLNASIPKDNFVVQVQDDYMASSLRLLDRESYYRYRDAEYNLQGGIKVIYDPKNYTYTIKYRENNKAKEEKVKDSDLAYRAKNLLLQQSRDELDKYKV